MTGRIFSALFVTLGAIAASGPLAAQDNFFAGKQIRIIVGTGAGGEGGAE